MKIVFLLPGNLVAGGVFVVYRHAEALALSGHQVTLCFSSFDQKKYFPKSLLDTVSVVRAIDDLPKTSHFDVCIATWWGTWFPSFTIAADYHFYFVQSDERKFYVEGDLLRDWVALTYSNAKTGVITEARWIRDVLKEDFNIDAVYSPNGVDVSIFNSEVMPLEPRNENELKILIEGAGRAPFKRVADAFAAIAPLRSQFNIKVWYVSNDGYVSPNWGADRIFRQVNPQEMPPIYSSCDILLKLSSVEGFFGPPLEMMATGGACVVSNVTGFDEYIVNHRNALVVEIGDIEAAREAVKMLLLDSKLRQRLAVNGLATAVKMDWRNQTPHFIAGINKLMNQIPTTDRFQREFASKMSLIQTEAIWVDEFRKERKNLSYRIFRRSRAGLRKILNVLRAQDQ